MLEAWPAIHHTGDGALRNSSRSKCAVGAIDVKNAKPTGVSVFETLFETPKPGVSAF